MNIHELLLDDIMEGVLVAALCQQKGDQVQSSAPLISGSGFHLQQLQLNQRSPSFSSSRSHKGGVILTSASWLVDILQLDIKHNDMSNRSEVRWKYKGGDDVQYVVLMSDGTNECVQSHDKLNHWPNRHVIKRAELVGVYLLPSVYTSLNEQLNSLSGWRVATESENERQREATSVGTGNDNSVSSLLLHLACVAVLKMTDKSSITRALFPLSFSAQKHQVSDRVHVVGTPFGSFCPEVFFNSLLSGCVCKLLSSDGAIFITDARVLPGCEGAPVFDKDGQLSGMVLSALATKDGHHAGLALACSIGAVLEALEDRFKFEHRLLRALEPVQNEKQLHVEMQHHLKPKLLSQLFDTVVMVTTANSWGSGIRLTPTLSLTCQHVVENNGYIKIGTRPAISGEIIFSSSLPDIALIKNTVQKQYLLKDTAPCDQCSDSTTCTRTLFNAHHQSTETRILKDMFTASPELSRGTEVYIIGYGFENLLDATDGASDEDSTLVCKGLLQHWPLVTKGHIMNVICYENEVVMFVTSAVVHSGMSGGLVVSSNSEEPLGMVISNSRNKETDTVYPSINYCLPFSVLLPPLRAVITTGNTSQLQNLSKQFERVSYLWELRTQLDIPCSVGRHRNLIQSKL